MSGESYSGSFYKIEADSLPRPQQMPLVVGGSGKEKTPRLAARYADEYNHFIAPAADIAPKVELLREAAGGLGRSSEDLLVSVMGPAYVRPSPDEFEQMLALLAAGRGLDPSEVKARWDRNGVPYGSPEQAAPALAALVGAGVDRYYLQWVDVTETSGLEANIAAMQSAIALI
jgi:alkanesulfonate monooxygenase SsuD/methylene tetrahydromethanopterin reductase-like flavin-dependent oxidoreductase (luciferase family)